MRVRGSSLNYRDLMALHRSTRAASGPGDPRETVGAPFFAADAVVDDEKATGIVFFLTASSFA